MDETLGDMDKTLGDMDETLGDTDKAQISLMKLLRVSSTPESSCYPPWDHLDAQIVSGVDSGDRHSLRYTCTRFV